MTAPATAPQPRTVRVRLGDCDRIARELDGAREQLKSCAPSTSRRACESAVVKAAVIITNAVIKAQRAHGFGTWEMDVPTEELRRVLGHIDDARRKAKDMPRVPRERRVGIMVRLNRAELVINGYLQLRLF